MDGELQIGSRCKIKIYGVSWMNWYHDTWFVGLGLLATATTRSRIDVMPWLWPLLEGRVVTQARPWFAVLVRTGGVRVRAGPCGLQPFAPLPAGVFCPVLLSWLSDGATLSENEHLCRSCPMQCPLLSFSWEGWEAREACRRHKTVGRWAPLKLARISKWSQRLEPYGRSQPARRSSGASLCASQCPLAKDSFLHVWTASDR